jgi:hypothetical protein
MTAQVGLSLCRLILISTFATFVITMSILAKALAMDQRSMRFCERAKAPKASHPHYPARQQSLSTAKRDYLRRARNLKGDSGDYIRRISHHVDRRCRQHKKPRITGDHRRPSTEPGATTGAGATPSTRAQATWRFQRGSLNEFGNSTTQAGKQHTISIGRNYAMQH